MHEGEDYYDESEISKKNKVVSSGPEWVERRRYDQEQGLGAEHHDPREILGLPILQSLEIMNRKGMAYERLKAEYSSSELEIKIANTKESFSNQLVYLHKELTVLAKAKKTGKVLNDIFPNALQNLLSSYFKTLDFEALKDIKKQFALDSEDPADEEEERRLIDLLASIRPDKSREDLEKGSVITDLASYIQSRYAKGIHFLTEETLLPILEHHAQEIMTAEQEMQQKIEEYLPEIKALFKEKLVAQQGVISDELLEERLGTLKFQVVDYVWADFDDIYGDFNQATHTIRLRSDIPTKHTLSVLVHELMHALSGQVELADSMPSYEDVPGLSVYDQVKVGMRFSKKNRTRWLNEAITEQETLETLDGVKKTNEQGEVYFGERQLLDLLIQKGVPKELLFAAYFENYDLSKPAGEHRLPKTKELFDFTNEQFGKRFLVNLDNFIKATSVKDAVDKWKTEDDNFPQFLQQWAQEQKEK